MGKVAIGGFIFNNSERSIPDLSKKKVLHTESVPYNYF